MSKFNQALNAYLTENGLHTEADAPVTQEPAANDPSIGQQEQETTSSEITANNVVTFASLLIKALQTDPDNISPADKSIFMQQINHSNAMDVIKQVTNMLQTV